MRTSTSNGAENRNEFGAVHPDTLALYRAASALGKEAMRKKKAQGETMHLAPLGYLNSRDGRGRSITVPNPKTHHLVERIHELRREGWSIPRICREMERLGLRSKRGKAIGFSSMLKILNRP